MRSLLIAVMISTPIFSFAHPSDLSAEAQRVACLDELRGYEFGNNQPERFSDMIQVRGKRNLIFAWNGSQVSQYSIAKGDTNNFKFDRVVWKRDLSSASRSGKLSKEDATLDIQQMLTKLIEKSMTSFAINFEKSGYRIGKNGAIGRIFHISKILNTCALVKGPRVALRQSVKLRSGVVKKVTKLVSIDQYRRFAFTLRPALANHASALTLGSSEGVR